jgi:hypothetical protein
MWCPHCKKKTEQAEGTDVRYAICGLCKRILGKAPLVHYRDGCVCSGDKHAHTICCETRSVPVGDTTKDFKLITCTQCLERS